MLFVHVPKAGGTSMERMFRRSGWKMRFHATRKTEPALMAVRRCSPQHYHAELLTQVLAINRFDETFVVVRDPIARFRSEYMMRTRARHPDGPPVDGASVEAWADQALTRYAGDPFAFDNHLRPQVEFLLPGASVHRLEDGLEAVAADLGARLGEEIVTDVPRGQDSRERSGRNSSDVELTPALEARLREFYAEDFARFGY